jgi:DNA helicase-2/ATP-dependent DNA helicase PcrA
MLHGSLRYPIRSRFVDEVPASLVKVLSAQKKESASSTSSFPGSWAAAAAPLRRAPLGGYSIGQSVEHAKFGIGVVINAEGAGDDVRLQINFAEHGIKWLDLRYAKLAPA